MLITDNSLNHFQASGEQVLQEGSPNMVHARRVGIALLLAGLIVLHYPRLLRVRAGPAEAMAAKPC